MNNDILSGKVGIIFGINSQRSIAWSVAQEWASQGATLVLSYQDEQVYRNVSKLAKQLRSEFGAKVLLLPCNADNDEAIDNLFVSVHQQFDHIDLLLHGLV